MSFFAIALTVIILLTIIGTIFCIIELFLPGIGVFGVTGIISLILSCVLSMVVLNFSPLYIFLGQIITIIIVGIISFNVLKNSSFVNKIILKDVSENGFKETEIYYNNDYIGKIGTAKSPLKPIGTICVNDKNLEALSEDGYINANENVIISNVVKNKIFVKKYIENK